MSVSLREIEEAVKRLQPENNCLRKTVRSSDLKIVLSLIGKCGGSINEEMRLSLVELTGFCGNEAFDRAVKRGQAVLSKLTTPTFSGEGKINPCERTKDDFGGCVDGGDGYCMHCHEKMPTEQKEYCECPPVKGVISAFCDICGKPIPAEKKECEFNLQSMDAVVWAKEFNRVLVSKGEQPWDEEFLVAWFANSIMAGYDEARRRYEIKPEPKPKDRIEPLGNILNAQGELDIDMTSIITLMKGKINEIIRHINKES